MVTTLMELSYDTIVRTGESVNGMVSKLRDHAREDKFGLSVRA